MKACSLHVVCRFREQEWGGGGGRCVGRMAGAVLNITAAEQRPIPTGVC